MKEAQAQQLHDLLTQCVVRVDVGDRDYGTGVFVAPGHVVTCGHVVQPDGRAGDPVMVTLDDGRSVSAAVRHVLTPPSAATSVGDPFPWPDLAWLTVDLDDHPWVNVDPSRPRYGSDGDRVWTCGYSRKLQRSTARMQPGAYRVEGPTREPGDTGAPGRSSVRWQLRDGQAAPGMSGAPLLNERTGRVLGLLTRSRGVDTDLGGWAVALHDALAELPELEALVKAAQGHDHRWRAARWEVLGLASALPAVRRPLPQAARRPPGALLLAAHAVVPFHPARQADLDQLAYWARTPGAPPVRLLTGPAGTGKTRLAGELCSMLAAQGWLARLVPRTLDQELVRALSLAADPTLLVFDYAETRHDLREALSSLADLAFSEDGGHPPLRVLLLARQSGDWWNALTEDDGTAGQVVASARHVELTQISDLVEDLQDAFRHAVRALALAQGRPEPTALPRLANEPWSFLRLHMAAVDAVGTGDDKIDTEDGQGPISAQQALTSAAQRERRYWRTSPPAAGVLLGDEQVMTRAVVALTLLPAADEAGAAAVLARVPDVATEGAVAARRALARWVRRQYPPETEGPDRWTSGMQPDLLAQHICAAVLGNDEELLSALFQDLSEVQAQQALTVLTRACRHHEGARELLEVVLTAATDDLALPALRVAVETGDPIGQVLASCIKYASPTMVQQLDAAIPHRTVSLREAAAETTRAMLEQAYAESDPVRIAAGLADVSDALAALGEIAEALTAIQQAVERYRQLALTQPGAHDIQLAGSLHSLGNRLQETRRSNEALEAFQEAAALYRSLPEGHAQRFRLAGTLIMLAPALAQMGRHEDALHSLTEAVHIYRRLTGRAALVSEPGLATALSHLGLVLVAVQRADEALPASEEAVSRWRRLTKARPDAHQPDLAVALLNRSLVLAHHRRHAEALEATIEAVQVFDHLARARPDSFDVELATAKHNLSSAYGDLDRPVEALAAGEDAVRLRRSLVARGRALEAGLASSLHQLSDRLHNLGRQDEALEALREAVDLRAHVAAVQGRSAWPVLSRTLHVQAARLEAAGRAEDASAAHLKARAVDHALRR